MSRYNNKVQIELGKKIKKISLKKNMKIVELARATGLTSSMISQVERSLISPSIYTLKKISDAFGMTLSSLLDEDEQEEKKEDLVKAEDAADVTPAPVVVEKSPVVREYQRKVLSPGPGVTFYLLNPDLSGPIEMIYNIYEPGTGTGNEQYTHVGNECGLILEGQLHVTIGDKEYVLEKGDSITFSSELPHSKTNRGEVPCICVWANTPPWF